MSINNSLVNTFGIDTVVQNTVKELKSKLEDGTYNMKVDLNILLIPIVFIDTSLANISKKTFAQLPLPVRNILLALGECTNEQMKLLENYLSEYIRKFLMILEAIVKDFNLVMDVFLGEIDIITSTAKNNWIIDLEEFRDELLTLCTVAGFSVPEKNIYDILIDLGTYLDTSQKETQKITIQVKSPDVQRIQQRLQMSESIRMHSTALNKEFHYQNIQSLPEIDLPEEETIVEEKPIRLQLLNTTKQENIQLIQEYRKLKGRMTQAWLPHRKNLQEEYRRFSSNFLKSVRNSIDQLNDMPPLIMPTSESLEKSKKLLEKELPLVIATFPCDTSALKTCQKTTEDGIKYAHVRKLKELRNELSSGLNMYLSQLNTVILRYHENARPPMFI